MEALNANLIAVDFPREPCLERVLVTAAVKGLLTQIIRPCVIKVEEIVSVTSINFFLCVESKSSQLIMNVNAVAFRWYQ